MARYSTRSIMEAKFVLVNNNGCPKVIIDIPSLDMGTQKIGISMSKAGIEGIIVPNDKEEDYDPSIENLIFATLNEIKQKLSGRWVIKQCKIVRVHKSIAREIASIYRDNGWFVYTEKYGDYDILNFYKSRPSIKKRIGYMFDKIAPRFYGDY